MAWPKGRPSLRKGVPLPEETRKKLSLVMRGKPAWNKGLPGTRLGAKVSDETKTKMSQSMRGILKSEEHKLKIKANAVRSFQGGRAGDAFAAVLCPVGFIREYQLSWGEDRRADKFLLDFAHVEGKINIELDGPYHKSNSEFDKLRDSLLQALGWKVIRIKHEGFNG